MSDPVLVHGGIVRSGGRTEFPAECLPEVWQALVERLQSGHGSRRTRLAYEIARAGVREYAAGRIRPHVPPVENLLGTLGSVRADSVPDDGTAGVAARLGVSVQHVRRLLTAGALGGRQVGPRGRWIIDLSTVDKYVEGKSA
jgi:excisionase family DNA binding protein